MEAWQKKVSAWATIARFQFYPMAFTAYSMGAATAFVHTGTFSAAVYGIGYAVLFAIEFCTILVNEYYDYDTDRVNVNFSMYTGGTRVLVDGRLTFSEVRTAIIAVLLLIIGLGYLLARTDQNISPTLTSALLLLGVCLGYAYTGPPIRFCYHGLGEMVVGFTHSFYLVLCGYVFQTGMWDNSLPWLLSMPLFFSVLAAITLAGLPDRLADNSTSKRTLAVIFGPRGAIMIAACFAGIAALTGVFIFNSNLRNWVSTVGTIILVSHGLALVLALRHLLRSGDYDRPINNVMALALGYIIWFGFVPLGALLWIGVRS